MAETLGALCDKLTIVKLKQFHSDDPQRLHSLAQQEFQLKEELDQFVSDALAGVTPIDRLTFASNKVYKREGNEVPEIEGGIAQVFGNLAEANCRIWHEQEKVYEFDLVPPDARYQVVKNLARFNLERNMCIDSIDKLFQSMVEANILAKGNR